MVGTTILLVTTSTATSMRNRKWTGDEAYRDQNQWCRMAIEGIARSGKFSSDRTISEYATQIWNIPSVPTPAPSKDPTARVRSYANMPI